MKIKFVRTTEGTWIARATWDNGDLLAESGPCRTKRDATLTLRAVLQDRIDGGTFAAMAMGELSKPTYRKGMW